MLPVAILAGGIATRLRPVTEQIPKALVEINGEPFLAHQLRLLHDSGIQRVVLCVGYLGEMIRDFAGEGSRFGLTIGYCFDGPVLRGTAGAIQNALPLLGEQFFVLYGDSYLRCDYAAVEDIFLASGKRGLMTVYKNDGQFDASNVEFDAQSIIAYDKRNRTDRMRHIDYGLGVFRAEAFRQIGRDGSHDLAELYQRLLSENNLVACEIHERFYEIGSFSGIEELSRLLAEEAAPTGKRSDPR